MKYDFNSLREIKIRAWDTDLKMWREVFAQYIGPPQQIHKVAAVGRTIITEYIGQKDKNKKDIFEGDILKTDEAGWVAEVVYSYSSFLLINQNHNRRGFSSEPNWVNCEIIGNIFENPTLLEE